MEIEKLQLPKGIKKRITDAVNKHSSSTWDLADAARDAFLWFRGQEETASVPEVLIWIAISRASNNTYSQEWFKKKAAVARSFPPPRKWSFGYYERIFDLSPTRNTLDPDANTREHCLQWLDEVVAGDEFQRVPGVTSFMLAYREHMLGQNLIPSEDLGDVPGEAVADHVVGANRETNPFGAFVWGMDKIRENIRGNLEDPRVQKVYLLIDQLKEALPACLEALGMKSEVDVK